MVAKHTSTDIIYYRNYNILLLTKLVRNIFSSANRPVMFLKYRGKPINFSITDMLVSNGIKYLWLFSMKRIQRNSQCSILFYLFNVTVYILQ